MYKISGIKELYYKGKLLFSLIKKLFSSDDKDDDSSISVSKLTNNTKKSNKIIENDKDIEKIIENFQDKKHKKYIELREKFGTEPPGNDVLWGLLQDLYIESFLKNHSLLLNVEYQRGLLLQKEKKYKDAISHYAYGLYYLLNTFDYPFSPNKFKMDIEGKEFFYAQEKFVNKLARCINSGKLDIEDFSKTVIYLISKNDFKTNITMDDFLQNLLIYLKDEFYDIDLSENINFNNIETTKISFYASKLRNLSKDLIKKKDDIRIIKTLNSLYLLGCLHEYLFGNYVSVGWTHDLADAKKKKFDTSKYSYKGKKIIYKSNKDYHEQFIHEYEKIFNKKLNYQFVDYTSDELLSDKDYKLFDKYLLENNK